MLPKSICALLTVVLSTAVGYSHPAKTAKNPAPAPDGAEIASVIDAVRDALVQAQTNNVPGFPPLKSVTVLLKTIASKEAGGKITFLVFSIGTKYKGETATALKFVLQPPATKSAAQLSSAVDPAKVTAALAQAINLAKAGILNGNVKEPKLDLTSVDIDLSFTVALSGSTGVTVKNILPVGLEGQGGVDRNRVHSITLKFSST
jgi:hypothetical protein